MNEEEQKRFAALVAEKVQDTFVCPHDVSTDNVEDMKEFLHEDRPRLRQFLDAREEMYGNVRKAVTLTGVGVVGVLVLWGLVAYIRAFPGGG